MSHWLFQQILQEEADRAPQQALQSTLNWMRALSLELVAAHGASAPEQFQSCLKRFRDNTEGGGSSLSYQAVFEPMCSSLTNALAICTRAGVQSLPPWTIPGAIVEWYYAHYMAVRSMLAASPQEVEDTHASVIKAFGASLRRKMPCPLDMVATWVKNEDFDKVLPGRPGIRGVDLASSAPVSRSAAQQMLVGYLSGTTDREVDMLKQRLRKDHGMKDFRKQDARKIRDDAIQKRKREINFMHCAFRYRGKANYRDAIYIVYGSRPLNEQKEFLDALAMSARFAFLCSLAFARVRLGKEAPEAFLADLARNLRGREIASPAEMFWQGLL